MNVEPYILNGTNRKMDLSQGNRKITTSKWLKQSDAKFFYDQVKAGDLLEFNRGICTYIWHAVFK